MRKDEARRHRKTGLKKPNQPPLPRQSPARHRHGTHGVCRRRRSETTCWYRCTPHCCSAGRHIPTSGGLPPIKPPPAPGSSPYKKQQETKKNSIKNNSDRQPNARTKPTPNFPTTSTPSCVLQGVHPSPRGGGATNQAVTKRPPNRFGSASAFVRTRRTAAAPWPRTKLACTRPKPTSRKVACTRFTDPVRTGARTRKRQLLGRTSEIGCFAYSRTQTTEENKSKAKRAASTQHKTIARIVFFVCVYV